MLEFLRKLLQVATESPAQRFERELLRQFEVYWSAHPSAAEDRARVAELVRERAAMTAPHDVESMLNPRVPPLKMAGVLDKIVDQVYGGNSSFFLKQLAR